MGRWGDREVRRLGGWEEEKGGGEWRGGLEVVRWGDGEVHLFVCLFVYWDKTLVRKSFRGEHIFFILSN